MVQLKFVVVVAIAFLALPALVYNMEASIKSIGSNRKSTLYSRTVTCIKASPFKQAYFTTTSGNVRCCYCSGAANCYGCSGEFDCSPTSSSCIAPRPRPSPPSTHPLFRDPFFQTPLSPEDIHRISSSILAIVIIVPLIILFVIVGTIIACCLGCCGCCIAAHRANYHYGQVGTSVYVAQPSQGNDLGLVPLDNSTELQAFSPSFQPFGEDTHPAHVHQPNFHHHHTVPVSHFNHAPNPEFSQPVFLPGHKQPVYVDPYGSD